MTFFCFRSIISQAIECGLNGIKNTLLTTENELDELVAYIVNLTQDLMYFEVCYGFFQTLFL